MYLQNNRGGVLLTIAIPFYNTVDYLSMCIESLVHQDLPIEDYEILMVDDGSTDGSLAVAQHYAQQYPNIRVISQPNRGSSAARNVCIKEAKGKYFRFVDSDDYIPQDNLKDFIDQVEAENLDMLRFDYVAVDEQDKEVTKPSYGGIIDYTPELMTGEDFLVKRLKYTTFACPYIIRRSIMAGIFFCEGDYWDDPEWTPRVCLRAQRVNSTPKIGYYYRQRATSLVHNSSPEAVKKQLNGHRLLIEEMLRQEALSSKRASLWYRGIIANHAISLLSRTIREDKEHISDVIAFFKSNKLLPLSTYLAEPNIARRLRIINISPWIYVCLIRLRDIVKR